MILKINFTFQSGYIQICRYLPCCYLYISLHSNLVIFKCNISNHMLSYIHLYIPIWLYSNKTAALQSLNGRYFTFQSGYIQMIDPSQVTVNDIVFTFQSGYIQMHMQKFVSNQVINFTFQSGYIQIIYDLPS